MSAGSFLRSRYQASYDTLQIHPIRVQPETVAATAGATVNEPPAGSSNSPISAQISKSRRSLGLHARFVTLQSMAPAPTGYVVGSIVRIPCLTENFYDAVSVKGTEVEYLGTIWQTVSVTSEKVN